MGKVNSSIVTPSAGSVIGISNETMQILKWVILTGLCQTIDVFGITTNIINIICFVKQGFKDPFNISLLGLSISDLGCLTTQLSINLVLLTPVISPGALTFDPYDINYIVNFMPHLAFVRVTSWITALITLERCLCIVVPLKVKSMLTKSRMTIIVVCVFVILFTTGAPVYAVNRLDIKFFPERNITILGLVHMQGRESVEAVFFAVNNFFIPFGAFIVIVSCTAVLVIKLHNVTKWRQSTSHVTVAVSGRNQKVARMVVMISVLFISCFIPMSIVILALSFEPELSLNGKHLNVGIVLAAFGFVLESANSSFNIFIYYHMSSKYRDIFHSLLCANIENSNIENKIHGSVG